MTGGHRRLISLPALAGCLLMAGAASADVSININIPAPVVALPAPPHMVFLPGPGVHVALGSPHHLFFRHGHYYLHHHDVWYVGTAYGGPWSPVHVKHLPPGLRKYRGSDWAHYQREADRHRHGKQAFVAGKGRPDHGGHPGKGKEKGGDKGNRH